MSSDQEHPIITMIKLLKLKGMWCESGTIEYEGKLYSYKVQELKKKPRSSR